MHHEWFGNPPFSIPIDLILVEWEDKWAAGLCGQCRANARQKTTEGQEKLFAILPSMFELPEWEELREKWST
ncbi:hypothetical protein FIBSPDRAFT_864493, partial [Athelia psychrophila]